jgi:hypothetical protein
MKTREQRFVLLLSALWLLAATAGLLVLADYGSRPGTAGRPPQLWPSGVSLARNASQPTLVMFLHPRCPARGPVCPNWPASRTANQTRSICISCSRSPQGSQPIGRSRTSGRERSRTATCMSSSIRAVCWTDQLLARLLACEFVAGIAAALWVSPYAWSGHEWNVHPHVWLATLLGDKVVANSIA